MFKSCESFNRSSVSKSELSIIFIFFGLIGVTVAQNSNLRRPGPRRTTRTTTRAPDSDEVSDDCPESNGYFADAEQCDKYYACNSGRIDERLCPDGMVFNDFDISQEKCDLPYNIDCSTRSELRKY